MISHILPDSHCRQLEDLKSYKPYTGLSYHKLNTRMLGLTKHTKDLAMDNWRLSWHMFALEQQMLCLGSPLPKDPADSTFLSPPRDRSTASTTNRSNPSVYTYEASSGFNTSARDSGQTEVTTPICMMHWFGWKYEGTPRAPDGSLVFLYGSSCFTSPPRRTPELGSRGPLDRPGVFMKTVLGHE